MKNSLMTKELSYMIDHNNKNIINLSSSDEAAHESEKEIDGTSRSDLAGIGIESNLHRSIIMKKHMYKL